MNKVTDEQIIEEYKKTGNIRTVFKKFRVPQSRVYSVVHKARHDKVIGNPVVKTLADFKSAHNRDTIIPQKIKGALTMLGKGGWEYELAFSKMAVIHLSDLGNFRTMFADYVVELKGGRRAWAGSVALAKQMREML